MFNERIIFGLINSPEPSYLDNISAYPKPVRTVWIVEHASGIKAEAIGFLDGLGRAVDLPVKQINAMRVELNASEIPPGLYYVRIRSGSKDRFIKIAVTH